MADVQTLYQLLLRNIHQDASSSNQKTVDSILRSIAESLKYLRSQSVYFNEKQTTIQLESGKNRYELPLDFLGIRGEVMYCQSATDTLLQPLINTPIDHLQITRPTQDDLGFESNEVFDFFISSDTNHSYYSIDTEGRYFYVGKQEGFVKLRYLADLGTIDYKHDGSNWVFRIPKTDTAITQTSTYTNKWFTDGFDVLKTRCEYYLWSREFGNTEAASTRAQIALGQSMDALSQAQNEGRARASSTQIRRWM